jgi:NAD(P)-dependent dehydrogenase (short-subunit alcohol dehydrogenase family)
MSSRLCGKIALITGGNSGIGFSAAKQFTSEGATVFVNGLREADVAEAVERIGPAAIAVAGDITKTADLERIFGTIRDRAGRLDILFANAGRGELAPIGQLTEAHIDKIFDVNVKGTIFTVQHALPLMPEGGAIVINGSMSTVKAIPTFGVYAASKAALRSLARTWALELKARKIRVNVLSPGIILTDAYKQELGLTDEQIELVKKQAMATTPLGRTGTAGEIARCAAFLASDEASYINGAELFVDGGAAQV